MKSIIDTLFNKIKQNIDLYLLTGLSFSLPFDRLPSVELFSVSIRFSTLFAFLIILRAAYLIISKKIKLKLIFPQKVLIFLIVWICLLIPESINLQRGAMVALFNIFTILTAISVSIIFDKKFIRTIIKAVIISSLIAVAFGFYQYVADLLKVKPLYTGLLDRYTYKVFGYPRIQAFSYEPLYFASYLMLPVALTLSMLVLKIYNIFSKKWLYTFLSLYCLAIFLTSSRGALYALLSLLVSFFVLAFIKKIANIKMLLIVLFYIAISFGASYIILATFNEQTLAGKRNQAQSTYTTQISDTSLEKDDERAVSRKLALDILKNNKQAWVIGVGPGQYGPIVQNNVEKSDGGWFIVNNLTLELIVELGLIGLAAVVLYFLNLFIGLYKNLSGNRSLEIRLLSLSLFGYLASQAVQYQSYSTLYVVLLWTVAGLSMATISSFKKVK